VSCWASDSNAGTRHADDVVMKHEVSLSRASSSGSLQFNVRNANETGCIWQEGGRTITKRCEESCHGRS
jgi:hypothetical protein